MGVTAGVTAMVVFFEPTAGAPFADVDSSFDWELNNPPNRTLGRGDTGLIPLEGTVKGGG